MNIRNRTEETPFMRAALGLRPETVQWFLGRYSTDDALSDLVTERDTHEQTALHKAALAKLERQSPFYEERRARKRDTIDALIDAEANPLTEDRKGKTPADIARENDDLESAEYLERLSTELTSGTEPMIDADPHQQMGLRMSACDQQAAKSNAHPGHENSRVCFISLGQSPEQAELNTR